MNENKFYLTIVVVIIAGTLFCAMRWNVWFYDPEEKAYEAPSCPSRILLTFGDRQSDSRNVSWTCGSQIAESYLELYDITADTTYLARASAELYRSRNGIAAYYVVKLRNLKHGHSYRYRASTGGVCSEWYCFTIPEESNINTSFIYCGDVQDTIHGIANMMLRKAFQNHSDAQFLVCGGDLNERPTDQYWNEAFRSLDSVCQHLPVLAVAGNHEYLKNIIRKLERRFTLTHSYYLDSKIDDNHVFTIQINNVQLFLLNSNREVPYLMQQARWLEQELKASDAKWKIVVLHHPLYSIRGRWHNYFQRMAFDKIIRKHGVDIVLQGHEHAYARMTSFTDNLQPTTPLYTISHLSPTNKKAKYDVNFDRVSTGHQHYQKIFAHGDTLTMEAYDAVTGSLSDVIDIVKSGTQIQILNNAGIK